MKNWNDQYQLPYGATEIAQKIEQLKAQSTMLNTPAVLSQIFGLIDLTTLSGTDNELNVKAMCEKVNTFKAQHAEMPNVAAICVYPALVSCVKQNLRCANVHIASVSGGFPASQTFIEIKTAETRMAVEAGANEIDMVISAGKFLAGDYNAVAMEIGEIKRACGDAHLKVILETGALEIAENIWNASILSMESGADFIKTSTGKINVSATLEAVLVMCEATKLFYEKTGRKIGLKPAGGISTPQQAVEYYAIVKTVLGDEWLNPHLFRIGASSLANNLLTELKYKKYF